MQCWSKILSWLHLVFSLLTTSTIFTKLSLQVPDEHGVQCEPHHAECQSFLPLCLSWTF